MEIGPNDGEMLEHFRFHSRCHRFCFLGGLETEIEIGNEASGRGRFLE